MAFSLAKPSGCLPTAAAPRRASRATTAAAPYTAQRGLAARRTLMRQYLRPGIVPVNPGIKTRASGSHPGAEEFLSVGSLDRSTQDLAALLYPGAVADLSEGLETPVQLFYLLTVLTILVAGAFLVVRQVLVRNQLEETIKVLGERKRKGEATAEDYFELGIILVRKKLYTQATQNLQKAKEIWDGEPEELAQLHNAIGFSYFNMGKYDMAVEQYKLATSLQPGYVTAWNNLGDAYENQKKFKDAVDCYNEVLSYAPDNKIALSRKELLSMKIQRLGL